MTEFIVKVRLPEGTTPAQMAQKIRFFLNEFIRHDGRHPISVRRISK